MTFDEILAQITELLQRQGRVSYGALKRRFALDDEYLQDLRDELITAQRLARDEDGKVLVWKGSLASSVQSLESESLHSRMQSPQTLDARPRTLDSVAERRQLSVMFCDLVGSTPLSTQLDPEELREVVRAYQATCTEVIQRYEGYVAQHLGDGILIYFGYPVAHEDDAARAVRAGLEIVAALHKRNVGAQHAAPLQVRIGIHTGLVVIGEIGSGEKREQLALGETPNIAARLQGVAEPDTVVISAATRHLVHGLFECQDLGPQELKGLSTPLAVYRVVGESAIQSRFEVAIRKGLTPLVGREHEIALLLERWQLAQEGEGQVVLLSGEPGIGKSRLVEEMKEQLAHERMTRIEFRCSPYHQNSALYPVIDHLQRLLQFAREDSPTAKLEKLQHTLSRYRFPQADTTPLLVALLSLPHPEGSPPITVSPQKQKEKTQAALVAWLVEEAELQPVYTVWEDLHWADPSTLEVLNLIVDQSPTARLLVLLTFRPEFSPPWGNRSHLSPIALGRLGHNQVETMVERVTGGQSLPQEVVQQIVSKTDGVPLFVEELTKTVVETIGEQATGIGEQEGETVGARPATPVLLAIPATLQDSLMARLDRLGSAKEIAQLGATIGREFSYELLYAVSNLDEGPLQQELKQLMEAELVYQRGLAPQAHYLFKHALIQDTAYQSLLKSRRQQLHQQIAQVLEERFVEIKEQQPELLAHHYTEANLIAQAIPYWQKAGQRAAQRSAHSEAISHLTSGLGLLKALPDTPQRAQHELRLQISLGSSLMATKGYGAPEVATTYTRARELCQQLGETPQLFPVLFGLAAFRLVRGETRTARELGEQLLRLARSVQEPALLVAAHNVLGESLYHLGEVVLAREQLEQGVAVYDPQRHPSPAGLYGANQGEQSLCYAAFVLWQLGYPDRALKRICEALVLAQESFHPYTLAYVLLCAAIHHQLRREGQLAQEQAEAVITLSTEQGFPYLLTLGTMRRGWALAEQGQMEEGIAQMHRGLAAWQATGAELGRSGHLASLAEAYGKMGQMEEGLVVIAEALAQVQKSEERIYEAELYRLKGELLLAQAREQATGNGQ